MTTSPSANTMEAETCVVSVTYGARSQGLQRVVEAALTAGAAHVVVVDNGCTADAREALNGFSDRHGAAVGVVPLGENSGSAGGYARGIRAALDRPATRHVWLLDDDNVPEPQALEALTRARVRLESELGSSHFALLSLRPDRSHWARIAAGAPPELLLPRPGSFLGLHLANLLRRLAGRDQATAIGVRAGQQEPIALPFCAYGGLFLPRRLCEAIGLPDERLRLDLDDYEYTARIRRVGGRLYLAPESVVRDLAPGRHDGLSVPAMLLNTPREEDACRIARNFAYLSTAICDEHASSLLYRLNRVAFFLRLAAVATRTGRTRRLAALRIAVRDGENGRFPARVDSTTKARP